MTNIIPLYIVSAALGLIVPRQELINSVDLVVSDPF